MNIFRFFLFLRFHTYYKSADDIKNIHNKLLSGQVTLLMFSSILLKVESNAMNDLLLCCYQIIARMKKPFQFASILSFFSESMYSVVSLWLASKL